MPLVSCASAAKVLKVPEESVDTDGAIRIDPFFFHPPDKATSRLGSKLPRLSLEMSEPARTGVGGRGVKSYSG